MFFMKHIDNKIKTIRLSFLLHITNSLRVRKYSFEKIQNRKREPHADA